MNYKYNKDMKTEKKNKIKWMALISYFISVNFYYLL